MQRRLWTEPRWWYFLFEAHSRFSSHSVWKSNSEHFQKMRKQRFFSLFFLSQQWLNTVASELVFFFSSKKDKSFITLDFKITVHFYYYFCARFLQMTEGNASFRSVPIKRCKCFDAILNRNEHKCNLPNRFWELYLFDIKCLEHVLICFCCCGYCCCMPQTIRGSRFQFSSLQTYSTNILHMRAAEDSFNVLLLLLLL